MFESAPYRFVLACTGCLIAGCNQTSPEIEAAKYSRAPLAYSTLLAKVQEDLGERMCLVIGNDNVESGVSIDNWSSYWRNADGSWYYSEDQRSTLTLSEVLAAVGLTYARYNEYMTLLTKAGGERITYCESAEHGTVADVLVHRSGLAVSGCSGEMRWTPDPTRPVELSGSDSSRILEVGDGWTLVYECT